MDLSYWEHHYLLKDIDYLIVGAGLTGLQTAINIKETRDKATVVVIDRSPWSLGASTRNAGFACFANISEIIDDLNHHSAESVYQLIAKRYQGLNLLKSKFGENAIGYSQSGSTEVFTNQNRTELAHAIDSLQPINSILFEVLGLDQIFQYSSNSTLPNSCGSISNKFEGQLNAGKLYTTIYNYAAKLEIDILGGLELESWEMINSRVNLKMKGGMSLNSKNIILCTNGFSSELVDEDIIPARGQVIVSEEVKELPCIGPHFFNKGYYYWRDIDNRILLGGARNLDF